MTDTLGEIVNRNKPCPICEKYIGSRGQHNHFMAHVRKGEMTVENDPISSLMLTSGMIVRQAARGDWINLPAQVFRLVR